MYILVRKAQRIAAKEALSGPRMLDDGTGTFGRRSRKARDGGMVGLDGSISTPRLPTREQGPQWRSLAP